MWYWECFTPHPPVIIPEVGKGRELEASRTIEGMNILSSLASTNPPDTILLLSPHAPFSGGLTISLAEQYSGDFARFAAPRTGLSLRGAAAEGERLARILEETFPVITTYRKESPLDHGSLVPLFFLRKRGVSLPSLVVANPIGLSPSEAYRLGQALPHAPLQGSWALVASGDLSHRVTPDAPAGFSPFGREFDGMIVEAFQSNDPGALLALGEREMNEAGECGLRSALLFLGLGEKRQIRSLSYEAPFGVGYATAFASLHCAPLLARSALSEGVRFGREAAEKAAARFLDFPELQEKAACFVSLKIRSHETKEEQLRGCIGTILPSYSSLLEEIVENTLAAAQRDPRFMPVTPEELENISLSVDILSTPEPVSSLDMLDPHRFGVLVEKNGRRGVLLPDLEGVDTVEQQLSIAARKAGILSLERSSISRFSVHRLKEDAE